MITPDHVWILQLHVKEVVPGVDSKPLQMQQAAGIPTGGFLELVCFSSGKEVSRITHFRQRLKDVDEFYMNFIDEPIRMEAFYADFVNITRPEWQLIMLNNFKEPHNLKFTVRLDLRQLVESEAS
jgi:hypothetical protein